MSKLINLNQRRKQKRRLEKAEKAAENRQRFGLSKAAKRQLKAERNRVEEQLDGKRMEPPRAVD